MTHVPHPDDRLPPQPGKLPNAAVEGKKRKKRSNKATESDSVEPTVELMLSRCAVNLSEMAQRGELRAAYGRDEEIEAVWQLLRMDSSRKSLLLGKARSGKTALAHEIARRIAVGDCPDALRGFTIYETSPASLTSALQFGEGWRGNLNKLIQGLAESGDALVFLRDTHNAVGAGKQGDDESDLADALVNPLRNSKLRWLAEARADLWRAASGEDVTFTECFTPVTLPELSIEATRPILEAVARDLATTPPVEPQPAAIETILDIAARFLLNQSLPGKAIDLLEDALRYVRRHNLPTLSAGDVVASFVERSGLARLLLDDDVPFDEAAVHKYFAERVLGQEPANAAVVQAIALLKARLNDPARPMGVFLFLGPTGVGKTELAKTLCAFLFGTEERLLRFNMADYAFYWQYEELFGDPDADELANRRGLLSRRLAGETFGVVLLDEFEKAHEMIFQRFLQVFDEGILVNPAGEEINLRNMVIIMTSNFGAQLLQGEPWGFAGREDIDAAERRILRETETFFTPEFINRLDSVIFFKPLSMADMRQIAYRELQKLFQREGLTRRNITIELDDSVVDLLLKHGYSSRYGARYLKRQIEKRISYPLARAILSSSNDRVERVVRLYARGEHIEAGWAPEAEELTVDGLEAGDVKGPRRLPSPTEIEATAHALDQRLETYLERVGVPVARARMDELLAEMSGPAFWDDGRTTEERLTELGEISRRLDRSQELTRIMNDLRVTLARIAERHERRLLPEAFRLSEQLERDLSFAELEGYFVEPKEWGDAYVVISTALGDKSATRWAAQLVDMYLGWARQHGLNGNVVDETPDDSDEWRMTLAIEGYGAYGLLQAERGTHRFAEIVRVGETRRKQVTQVRVEILPVVEENAIRIPTGDQAVDSRPLQSRGRRLRRLRSEARAVYLPNGATAVVTSDSDPATAEALAVSLLRGRLLLARANSGGGLEADAPWGAVARAYQLSRHSTVKDPRTGVAHRYPRAVFDGDLNRFIEGYLRKRSEAIAAA
jgi:ATP-dependent Clp protease ATP-binding subunit ClpA/protein subunit release factor B